MGAHGTFEEALANVTSFVDACNEREREQQRSSDKRHKHKSKKEKKVKKDKGKKDKRKKEKAKPEKRKKDSSRKDKKRHSKAQRSSSPTSSTGGSSSDGSDNEDQVQHAVLSVHDQLERGRQAVRLTRQLLVEYPALRGDLRELLRRIDSGESVDVTGLPDPKLRGLLQELFHALCLKCTSKGLYSRSAYHATVVGFLAPVMEETAAQLAERRAAAQQQATQTSPTQVTDATGHRRPDVQRVGHHGEAAGREGGKTPSMCSSARLDDGDGGPIAGPPGPAAEPSEGLVGGSSDESAGDGDAAHKGDGRPGKVVGPAMPPREVLEAAAAAAAQLADEEQDEEEEEDFLIGPPPPDFIAEADAVAGDERASEVVRVLRILSEASGSGRPADPYAVLGVEQDAKAGDIKKRYWRLSLAIHPDKCDHPRAHDAFQAVGKAAKELQDEGQRAAVDKRLENEKLEEAAQDFMLQQERERQWRIVRGQATAEDLAGPAGPAQRDTWMTHVPAARQSTGPVFSQSNVTSFSMRGVQGERDTSGWTSVPGKKQEGPALLTAGGQGGMGPMMLESGAVAERNAVLSGLVDTYNDSMRKKSLVEQHQEKLQAEKSKKKAKKRKAGDETGQQDGSEEWAGKHPWRPFDREKDLSVAKSIDPADVLKRAGNLSSRFAGSGGQGRTFL